MEEASKVCLTTDCWTSVNNEAFIAVTAHFVDRNFELQSVLLTCKPIVSTHTSKNLADELGEIIKDWNLGQRVLIFVSENAYNVVGAVKNHLMLKHLGCAAHMR